VDDPGKELAPGAWMKALGRFYAKFEPLEDEWMRFFPRVQNPRNLPPPFSGFILE
jgi:hypothetical protein